MRKMVVILPFLAFGTPEGSAASMLQNLLGQLWVDERPEKEEDDHKKPLEEQEQFDEAQKELEKERKRVFDLYKALEIPKQEPKTSEKDRK